MYIYRDIYIYIYNEHSKNAGDYGSDWIGLREILQETIDFPIKFGVFL